MQYSKSIPSFISILASAARMQRLRKVGMNCGCEYTSWPLFKALRPYSRYEHSLGTALIVWNFTLSPEQSIAALFHDISTPCFAHSIDFMLGDYKNQEATETRTRDMIESSAEIVSVLSDMGLEVDQVCNYHIYPAADSPAPHLCADRLEYSLRNMVNYGVCTAETAERLYRDVILVENECGFEEFAFRTFESGQDFAFNALRCSHVYACEEDRYTMQILSELVATAIGRGTITADDLYDLTEDIITARLIEDPVTGPMWKDFCMLHGTISGTQPRAPYTGENPGPWRKIEVKKRVIDPIVDGEGRLSDLSAPFREELDMFLEQSQDVWICKAP